MTLRTGLRKRRDLPSFRDLQASAGSYQPPPGLDEASDVAVALGVPLLLTGDPGTGKSQAAYYLARRYDVPSDRVFRLEVDSSTSARDLTATVDTVAYFHAAQDPRRADEDVDPRAFYIEGPLYCAFQKASSGAIILIDEIDKADRDFPNDLLNALDQYTFVIRETNHRVTLTNDETVPLVVITSNTERRLPDPFLRRCIYYHIDFTEELLRRAVEAHRDDLRHDRALVDAAIMRFLELRHESVGLLKKPSTGELLHWLYALRRFHIEPHALNSVPLGDLPALSTLIKTRDDLERLRHT